MTMDKIPGGYWRAVAEGFIQSQLNKPFFGRPYVKLGQCLGIWSYLFEVGGILGAKHAAKTDAFVTAFLGMSGAPGVAKGVLVERASEMLQGHSLTSMTFWDYIGAEEVRRAHRVGYKVDGWHTLIKEQGAQKIPPDSVLTNSWEYASAGAALGTTHLDVLRAMFERTYATVPEQEWQRAYAAGLDIGPEQPRTTYKEAENTENKNFIDYCQKFRPDLYPLLRD
jgi:hypothetical protein